MAKKAILIKAWDKLADDLKKDAQFQKMIQELNDSYQKRITGK